ncbi:MAG: hypothetical protein WCL59_02770, partial [Cyanobium sp. ELA507]
MVEQPGSEPIAAGLPEAVGPAKLAPGAQALSAGLPPWLDRGLADLFPAATAPEAAADPDQSLAARLAEAERNGRPLRVKLGIDPTGSDIHLGHSILFR